MTDTRAALLVVLCSSLFVVSCATLLEWRAATPPPMVEPVAAEPPPAPPERRRLLIPVQGITREALRDNFGERRGRRIHGALDIMARRGTPVLAAGDGRVAKMYRHPLGGLCLYQYDAENEYVYYYAHLDAFAKGIANGSEVKRGDLLGYVGSTGNASPAAPHLHFALIKLGPDGKWYKGTPVNPYPYLVDTGR